MRAPLRRSALRLERDRPFLDDMREDWVGQGSCTRDHQTPLVPAPGTHENRRCETIHDALLCPAIFAGTRIAGTQGSRILSKRPWIPAYAGMSGRGGFASSPAMTRSSRVC